MSEVLHVTEEGARTGADLVVDCLAVEGVTHVFGLPGTTVMDVIDALARNARIRYLSTRHEQVAGFMADGFSRASRGLGVCLASRGPGAANLAIAVQNAYDESVPMVALVGQVPGRITERRAFEEMDIVSVFRPMSKWAVEVGQAERIPELLQRAVRTAVSGRPGPVVVSLPLDVLQAPVEAEPGNRHRAYPPGPDAEGPAAAAALMAAAYRPVLMVGGGLRPQGQAAVAQIAETLDAPVVTTWLRKGGFPNAHPRFLGALGYGALETTDRAVAEADAILALGCRFSEFTTKGWTLVPKDARLVHMDVDPEELGRVYEPDVAMVCDAGAGAHALSNALPSFVDRYVDQASARSRRFAALRAQYDATRALPSSPEGALSTPGVSSAALARQVQRLASREDIVTVQDVHTFGPWIQRHVDFSGNGSHFAAAGGAMGWGLPAAMGAALARPDERVLAISGDGSFWMVAQDLETCVREGIAVVNLVVNNFSYGNTRDRQRYSHGGRYAGVFHGNPDLAEFARQVGAFGARAESDEDLATAIEEALRQPTAAVIDVVQDKEEGLPEGLRPLRAH
ncbi:thiamine pyrophosphate-binding protein [Nocardiopsis nanhaiensis]